MTLVEICPKCGRETAIRFLMGAGKWLCEDCYRSRPWIVCPRCGMVSHNPNDVEQRYCGNCHLFHEQMEYRVWIES